MSDAPSPKPATTPAKNGGRKKVILVVAVVLVIIGLAVGIPWYIWSLSHRSTDDAFLAANITLIAPRVPGHVVAVRVEDNQWVEEGEPLVELDPSDYEARLAQDNAALQTASAKLESAKSAAKLTSITANAALDEATQAVKLAESALGTARARVGTAASKRDEAAAALTAARAVAEESKADVVAAEAQAQFDNLTLKRFQDMFKGGAITQQEMDRATSVAQVSQANLETARKKVASAEARAAQAEAAGRGAAEVQREAASQSAESESAVAQARARLEAAKSAPEKILVAEADVRVAEAEVAKARAAVRQSELALSYTHVLAPRAGRVTSKSVRRGSYVMAGQSLLAIVPAEVWVIANYKETDLTDMQPGQPVSISVDAYPDAVFKGRVDSIQAGTGASFSLLPPENASGNYIKVVQRVPVKIVFETPPDLRRFHLAPGMSVVPTVDVSARPAAPEPRAPTVKEPGAAPAARRASTSEAPS